MMGGSYRYEGAWQAAQALLSQRKRRGPHARLLGYQRRLVSRIEVLRKLTTYMYSTPHLHSVGARLGAWSFYAEIC